MKAIRNQVQVANRMKYKVRYKVWDQVYDQIGLQAEYQIGGWDQAGSLIKVQVLDEINEFR